MLLISTAGTQIRDLLGHASIVTTERYDNQRPEALMAAAKLLESTAVVDTKTDTAPVVDTAGERETKHYRKYKIKTAGPSDDYGALKEVLTRRYRRAKEEDNLPDLILIDGGKGHLNLALQVLRELGLKRRGNVARPQQRQAHLPHDLDKFGGDLQRSRHDHAGDRKFQRPLEPPMELPRIEAS